MSNSNKKKIITALTAGGALVIYLVLRRLTGFSVPCLFHTITGFKCPGCGVTHMLDSLLSLDIKGAREANAFIFFTSPFLIFEIIYELFMPHNNSRFKHVNNALLIVYCFALIIFGITRNLPSYPFY